MIMGRHGDDLVWGPEVGVEKGEIGWHFVVKALGDVVAANEVTAEREAARRRRELSQKQQECDEEQTYLADDSEMMPEVHAA